jgi:hypothetical protein
MRHTATLIAEMSGGGRRLRRVTLLLVALALLAATIGLVAPAMAAASAVGYTVTGNVYAPGGVTPLEGVRIEPEYGGTSAITGSDGSYVLSVPTWVGSSFKIRARCSDYDDVNGTTYLDTWFGGGYDWSSAKAIAPDPILLTASGKNITVVNGARIAGTVRDKDGSGIEGAEVSPESASGYYTLGYADATGGYSLLVPAGTYTIHFMPAWGSNFLESWYPAGASSRAAATRVRVSGGDAKTGIDGVLPTGGTISGTVTGPDGKPAENVRVDLDSMNESRWDAARTDASGHYEVVGLQTGQYSVSFAPDDYNVATGQKAASQTYDHAPADSPSAVSVTGGSDTTSIDATLDGGGTLSGQVTGADGRHLSGVSIRVQDPNPFGSDIVGSTDLTGAYTITQVPLGHFEVAIDPSGFNEAHATDYYDAGSTTIDVTDTSSQTKDITLEIGASISGTVTGDGDAPLPGVWVNTFGSSASPDGLATDSSGNYVFHGIAPGEYTVSFSPSDYNTSNDSDYIEQYWNAKDAATADRLTLEGGDAAVADAQLVAGGRVTGTIKDGKDGTALAYASVNLQTANGRDVMSTG